MSLNEIADVIEGLEIPMDIEDMFDENGNHITNKKYGKILINNLCDILRSGKTFGGKDIVVGD